MPHLSPFLLFFTIFLTFILRGQTTAQFPNLVKNPSFEQRAVMRPNQTITVIDSIEEFIGWSSIGYARAEMYGTDSDGFIRDPTNIRGQRNFNAHSGKHVAMLETYSGGKRSYLQGELTEPLVVGQKYYVGFWSHFHCLATNNICLSFSMDSIQTDSVRDFMTQVKARLKEVNNYDKSRIWQSTIDSFIAEKPYNYIVFGNFYKNAKTSTGGSMDFNHYIGFIDDVFVIKAKSPVMQINRPLPQIVETKKPTPLPKVLNKVQFLYNSVDFEPNSLPQLDSAVVVLKKYLTLEILIKGHTSSEGEAEYNQKLSERRAEAVMNYLIQHGIEAKRLQTQGFGETRPLVLDDTEEHKRVNRRIEFEILKE